MPSLFNFSETIRGILSKKNFDFSRTDINLNNFHPQLGVLFALNGIFFTNRNSMLRFIWPICCTLIAFTGLVLEFTFFYGGLVTGDYGFATECFCYFILIIAIPVINASVLLNTNKIYELVQDMDQNFVFVCSVGAKHRDSFLAGQLLIWKLCCVWLSFCVVLGSVHIVFPSVLLTYQTLFKTQTEHMTKPLPFPAWLPNADPYSTPYYEIIFFLETIITYTFTQTFDVYVYIQFHVLLHYGYILDMIMLDFEALFDELDVSVVALHRDHPLRQHVQRVLNMRMKRIVTWHISVFKAFKNISSIYGPPLAYQLIFSSLIICLLAYQFAEKINNGVFDIFLCMLGVGACSQLWICCYLGTLLRNKAFAVGEACWTCGWHENPLGRLVRQDIIIFILRAQQPVTIKFTGLPSLQLETFTSIMSSAYSYFNMLRQYGNADIQHQK